VRDLLGEETTATGTARPGGERLARRRDDGDRVVRDLLGEETTATGTARALPRRPAAAGR
jgi:hypothetical protein